MQMKISEYLKQKDKVDILAQQDKLLSTIEISPDVMDGLPCIRGTRIPVYIILELLQEGHDVESIIKEYPNLSRDKIKAALHFAGLTVSL
jgi:uncharacterized protein (DUF433 family)